MTFIVTKNGPSTSALREWGNSNGFPAKDETRGRLPRAALESLLGGTVKA